MARLNVPRTPIKTHEGATAYHINSELQLRRSVMSCLLWEDDFYEDGESIAKRIAETIPKVSPSVVSNVAIEARAASKLRHVPLLIVREMARLDKYKPFVSESLSSVIQRADELTEFLSIYWKDGRQPLSAQVKRGLARAFTKFNEYELAKYNRDGAIKLRDALFLCHAKPKDADQEAVWKRLVNGEMAIPDTWEVALSAADGLSKKEKWERLLAENKLGALALLRNLRNMQTEKVDNKLIKASLSKIKVDRVLPYRFIAAARYAPQFEPELETAMFKGVDGQEKLPGTTLLLVDISGSMTEAMSGKSELRKVDAACGLAILARELCENPIILGFSDNLYHFPPRRGFALRDAICGQVQGGTYLGAAIKTARRKFPEADRTIVITDEQAHDTVGGPIGKGYLINVASAKNGVGYGPWTHIDGFSESVLRYIQEIEKDGREGINNQDR